MTDDAKTNRRLGIKVPRSTLLPPYLMVNDYFVEYTNAIDDVFGRLVDSKAAIISNLRNMWVQNPDTEALIQEAQIIPNDAWSMPERAIVVQQVNLLGMKLQNAGIVSDDAYQTISRFVGQYWYGKGTYGFIDFINYCLSSNLQVTLLWTQNYEDFLPEGDAGIGTPVWEGGTWYPTTHVLISVVDGLGTLDIATLQSFFYEIANYNLVLQAVNSVYNVPIVANQADDNAVIVALGLYVDTDVTISSY